MPPIYQKRVPIGTNVRICIIHRPFVVRTLYPSGKPDRRYEISSSWNTWIQESTRNHSSPSPLLTIDIVSPLPDSRVGAMVKRNAEDASCTRILVRCMQTRTRFSKGSTTPFVESVRTQETRESRWVCPNLNYPSPRTGISNSGYSIAARYEERRSHRWYRHVPAGISLIIIRLSTVQIRDIRRPRNARACVPTLLPLSYRERRPSSWRP